MSRFLRLIIIFVLGMGTAASAAVVQRPSPSLTTVAIPASAPALSMSGSVTARFTPVLSGVLSNSLLATPALLPALPAPVADIRPIASPAQGFAVLPLSGAGRSQAARGPPTARDAEYGALVSRSVADKAREWAVPAEEILNEHDAILVGENHHSLASVGELTRALPGLARGGVKVLGIEGLKRPSQDAVDAYLSRRVEALPPEVLSFSPRRREAFEALFRSARDNGVRVVALGLPLDVWARQTAELAAERTGDPVESFYREPGEQLYRAQTAYEPGYNEAVADVYLTRRNESMAAFLAEAMAAGAKAVVLVGQNHVEGADAPAFKLLDKVSKWGTMTRELARLGLKAFSLTLTGGLYTDAEGARDDREIRRGAYARAAEAAPDGKPAFVRTGEASGLYHAGGTVPAPAASRGRH